jgi:16S rRNA (cytosine1402-N4)-methyltransferase
MDFKHISVLLQEAVDGLIVKPEGLYIDATAGGGGHTEEIVKRGGRVLALDQDPDAIEVLKNRFEKEEKVLVAQGNFGNLVEIAKKNGFEKVDGVLFDLGLSSYQIDSSGRGFSFRKEEILDMRMNKTSDLTAKEIVNSWSGSALYDLFSKIGEEHFAQKIVDKILEARSEKEIETGIELSKIVEKAVPVRGGPIHPATRVFQALRIAVNDELENLKKGIEEAFTLLNPKGRMSVISFHSLEDRIVKLAFLGFERKQLATIPAKKPITPSILEVEGNRRSRSAKLRIIEKI